MKINIANYLCILLGLFLSVNCFADGKNTPLLNVDFSKEILNIKKSSINDISGSLDFIQLETSDSVLIGKISNVLLHDNYLFIVYKNQCTQFNKSGKFIRNIGKKGH